MRDPRAIAAQTAAPVDGSRSVDGPRSAVAAAYGWRAGDDPTWRFFERDPRAITIRYEDLVRDPAAEMARLSSLIGEPFEGATLGPLGAGAPPTTDHGDAWRESLAAADQDRVALICGDGLARYGYEGARPPTAEAWVKPLDAAFIADAEPTLARAADAGVVLRMSAAR